MGKIWEVIKTVGKAVYNSGKVRLAFKALLLAVGAVVADFFGVGQPIIDLIANM